MEIIGAQPKYDAYRDSGNKWLGEIPSHWKLMKFKYLARIQKGKLPEKLTSNDNNDLPPYLSMEYLRGGEATQFVQDKKVPIIDEGEVLLLWDGSNSGEFIKSRKGVISSTVATIVFSNINKSFAWYSCAIVERLLRSSTVGMGIPHVDGDELKNSLLAIPTIKEQTTIANFLDTKTAQIDEAIIIKERQIELLKERKQLIIQQGVTKGLPAPNGNDVPMKDSGVEWIGEIPEHWEVKRAKYLFNEIDERSINGDEELLSVSHLTGITPRSEKSVTMVAEDYSGSKTCKKNDLVMNIMWAWMGAMGVSDRPGIVSSAYSIFRQTPLGLFNPVFLEWLVTTVGYIEHYNKVSTGLHSSRLRFYSRMFFDMEIGYPSREEQDEIVDYVESQSQKIDQAVVLQSQQIEKLKEYKTTLINSAVTGKIKVPNLCE